MATIDFTKPITSDLRAAVLAYLRDFESGQARLYDGDTLISAPVGAVRYSSTAAALERWSGSAWADLPIKRIVSDSPTNRIFMSAPLLVQSNAVGDFSHRHEIVQNTDGGGYVIARGSGTNLAAPGLLADGNRIAFFVGSVGNGTTWVNTSGLQFFAHGAQTASSLPSRAEIGITRANQTSRNTVLAALPGFGSVGVIMGALATDSPTIFIPTMPGQAGEPSLLIEGNNNRERMWIRSGSGSTPVFNGLAAGGTPSSPTATVDAQNVASYQGGGYDGSIWTRASWLGFYAAGNWGGGSRPMRAEIWTTPVGSTTIQKTFTFSEGGWFSTDLTGSVQPPSFSTRSIGTKLLLYPELSASSVDYAIGIHSSSMWFSVPSVSPERNFYWYAGQTAMARLSSGGALSNTNFQVGLDNGQGGVRLQSGSGATPGYVAFYTNDGVRRGFFGWENGGRLTFQTENTWGMVFVSANSRHDFGGSIHITTGSPTQWWQDTDHRAFAIHVNGDLAYFMRGGVNDPNWTQIADANGTGRWMWVFNLNNGSIDAVGPLSVYNIVTALGAGDTASAASIEARSTGSGGSATAANIRFHRPDSYGILLSLRTDNVFALGGWSHGTNTWRWTSDTSGNFVAQGNVTAYSDERLKDEFAEYRVGLDDLLSIDSLSYRRIDTGERQIGVRAQQLQRVMPLAVHDGDYLSVDYGRAALAGVLSLAREVRALKEQINAAAQ